MELNQHPFHLLNQICYTKYYIMEPQTELCLINAKIKGHTHKKPNKQTLAKTQYNASKPLRSQYNL